MTVFELADAYIEKMAALDPLSATSWGVSGHEHRLTDFSPEGVEARVELQRSTIASLTSLNHDAGTTDRVATDRVATDMMLERLRAAVAIHDAGETLRPLKSLGSPMSALRSTFDHMRLESMDDWEVARARLAAVPSAINSIRVLLESGMAKQVTSARRQVQVCATQCETWGDPTTGFFASLAKRGSVGSITAGLDITGGADVKAEITADVTAEAEAAAAAYRAMAGWLRETYAHEATVSDAVGEDRYALWSLTFNGAKLDLHETYDWGWSELRWIERRMAELAERILPNSTLAEAIAHIEADEQYAITGVDEFLRWNQNLIDTTIADMHGKHFDIDESIRRCEAMIAPPGGAAAMYHTAPSEDLTRPGRTWYPTLGKTRFPLWREVSICYHEGVPGHHLQLAQTRLQAKSLTRFQRLAGFTSGHGEGWALYAERLMQELGYLDDPVYELGWLSAQAMRAVRVIVDIGMHLELRIPTDERYHPGEVWTPELALPFVIERSCFPEEFMQS